MGTALRLAKFPYRHSVCCAYFPWEQVIKGQE